MAAWTLKTEPDDYSLDDLERDGTTRWDGVGNNAALKHMRLMQPGEMALIYHTGKEKAVVGVARLASGPYADPAGEDAKRVVVDVEFDRRLPRPVTLAEIKADPDLAEWPLVRQGRLSVVPTPPEVWQRVLRMAESEDRKDAKGAKARKVGGTN